MARKQSVENLFHTNLKNRIAFGQSKHADKAGLGFGQSTYKIYSYSTYNTYIKETEKFARFLEQEKGIKKTDDIAKTEQYAKEYLQSRLVAGCSVWTVKMERSALGMLYGKRIEIEMPVRNTKNITRSRNEVENDKHYSRQGKYHDIFILAASSGCRRCDLINLKTDCLVEKDGHLYIKIEKSKGGRDRLSYVRTEYAQEVKSIIESRQKAGYEKVFDKIPDKIDVHSLRREYCQSLYNEIKDNKELRDDILKNYPPRKELKTQKDKDGNTYTKEIQRDYYKCRDGSTFLRQDLFCLSQNLGHNRLDVTLFYVKS